jgi:adenine deaminase
VGIAGDRIVEIVDAADGGIAGTGRREIDATGRLVTPGFVDIHTHLDAQLAWDPIGTSSCWHGVTSVVMGNCGVTFAPCRPGDRATLAEMMESVEDIPADAVLVELGCGSATKTGALVAAAAAARPGGAAAPPYVGLDCSADFLANARANVAPAEVDAYRLRSGLTG